MFAFIIITGKSISRKEEKWHYNTTFKSKNWEDSLVIQWLGLSILCAWVWSLVRKLRSCKLWSKKKERKKISLSLSLSLSKHWNHMYSWAIFFFLPYNCPEVYVCLSLCLVAKSCPTLATPWILACQDPLSLGFSS